MFQPTSCCLKALRAHEEDDSGDKRFCCAIEVRSPVRMTAFRIERASWDEKDQRHRHRQSGRARFCCALFTRVAETTVLARALRVSGSLSVRSHLHTYHSLVFQKSSPVHSDKFSPNRKFKYARGSSCFLLLAPELEQE